MDYENNYRELRATIEGRLEGYNSFLNGFSEEVLENYKVTRDARAQKEELEYLLGIINRQKNESDNLEGQNDNV